MPEHAVDPVDPTEVRLRAILDRIDGWLRYAEAKNAGVIALAGTANAAILAFARPLDMGLPALVFVTISQVAFLLALVIGIASFLPQTRFDRFGQTPAPTPNSDAVAGPKRGVSAAGDQSAANLFFYGHLAALSADGLATAVARIGHHEPYDASDYPLHVMIAGQIVANAKITVRKLRWYAWAAWMAMLGAIALALTLVVRLASVTQ